MMGEKRIKSVAIIGAGAAGAATAAALKAENYFDRIRVFERRETAGGTWIHDPDPGVELPIHPGGLPADVDPRLEIPNELPKVKSPNKQERFLRTPVYNSLTTNVPDIAMCFSDSPFPYGPFVPHHVPREYVASYFSLHKTDGFLELNTTVEDLSRISSSSSKDTEQWRLTLRKYEPARQVDFWWEETFDAVILANGHYSVPFVPQVKGLDAYTKKFPGRVVHSKHYRTPLLYSNKKVLTIGNSASGHDLTAELVSSAHLPVYQSRRSKSRWDGNEPPYGIAWEPIIKEYKLDGRIIFEDDTYLDDIDTVIYCTGYKASFPFWNEKANGRPLWDYESNKIIGGYWHTFFQDFDTLAIVGLPRVLTFRSFEYQAIALARLFSGRNSKPLPPLGEQGRWDSEREKERKKSGKKFHDIEWETGETEEWLRKMFEIAGLGTLKGEGRVPPVLGKDLVWAIENLKKYPEPGKGDDEGREKVVDRSELEKEHGWVVVQRERKDLLAFI
ncbi:Thiol-specific monooxygenase [Lachnellula cervina]|uniref:Thiol-specific monooxygenase n=1 Tax=Lachnellula cervina TaxID=1316786 RepID=A0A7D8UZX4_9HELO|nr:Thiol-specific monooxygenase [Lachnellula cervina]